MFVVDTDDPEIMMYLGQDEPLPGTPEFGERARRRIAIIKGTPLPVTKAPPMVETAVAYWGEKAEEALFGDITRTLRTLAMVGVGVGVLYLLAGRR